ncbi:MAG: glycoside hydrolase family 140 protein [Draconibacterium sp.]|nr:glycoside hydrolase family 140 protein [Draconibacterium sp.]
MKTLKFLTLILLFPFIVNSQELRVSDNNRRLVNKDGSLFFYMADTGWELFHRATKEQTEMYLKDRKAKGFNVIQAVILAEIDGLNTPNEEGEKPFTDLNTLKPNEAYFKHVDWVIAKAEELGIYIAALPTWGDKWNLKWGKGPVIFDTPEKARKYGKYLGERYENQPNIIWVIGGDRSPDNDLHLEINRAMAEGVKEGDKGKHLMTYHPSGSVSSSRWFHNDKWLDFNMLQSGHSVINRLVHNNIRGDYNKKPVKPCLNGEPQYEDIPVGFKTLNERFVAFDVRQSAYWSVLAGALGHTYGNNNIWQMWTEKNSSILGARIPWYEAIHQPGALQMGFMRKLFESRPFLKMIPDQDILADVYGQNKDEIRAAKGKDGSFVIAYSPYGKPIHLKLNKLSGETINGYWYNPREDESIAIASFKNRKEVKAFDPPSSGTRTDWVLLLDDAGKKYPDPVSVKLN